MMVIIILLILLFSVKGFAAQRPHIVFFMADDLGYANVNFNREYSVPEVSTPSLDGLVDSGIHLRRMYTYMVCSQRVVVRSSAKIIA